MSYKLIITIVPHDCGDLITNAAVSAGASGGTILMGRGTAESNLLQLLGFGDSSKDITYNIVDTEIYEKVRNAIIVETEKKRAHFGVLFSIDVNAFTKAGASKNLYTEDVKMEQNSSYEMINVIVNKGYGEDAMAAARKAGARGGTIIGARGTAKDGDEKFFGMEIVPEKEMLMILVPTEQKEAIISAITALPCFEKAGSGIVFSNQASDFTMLGKKS